MVDRPVWQTEKGVIIQVVVRPNSKDKKLIAEITPEAIHVNLSSQAREGKANIELLKRLAKLLKISTSEIIIVAGQKSREKRLLIISKSLEDIEKSFNH